MKTPSDELFLFVKSLEKYEITYVKRCFSRDADITQSAQLFDYLCTCKEYDEGVLLKKNPYLNPQSIKHSKYNLYTYLLKAVEECYSERDEEQQLNKLLIQIQLLRKKRFYKKAKQLLAYAMEQAKKNYFFLLQVQLQAEAELLAFVSGETTQFTELKNKSKEHTHSLLEDYKTKCFFLLKRYEAGIVRDIATTEKKRVQEIKMIYSEIIHSKQKKGYNFLSLPLKLGMMHVEYLCLYLLHDYTAAKKCFIIFLEHYMRQNMQLQENQSYLLFHLANGTAISTQANDKALLFDMGQRADVALFSIKNKTKVNVDYYFKIKINVIAYMCYNRNYQSAKIYSEKLLRMNIQKNINADTQKIFLCNLCWIYLHCNEPKKALAINNLIRNNKTFLYLRTDANNMINIMELAVFYDLRMWSNIKSTLGSLIRDKFSKQQSIIYQQLIYLFYELIKIKNKAATKELFIGILKKIDTIKKTDTESLVLIEDKQIKYWLEKKLKPNLCWEWRGNTKTQNAKI